MNALRSRLSAAVADWRVQVVLVLALLLAAPLLSPGTLQIANFVLVAAIFAQSINLLTGLAGPISLGHSGFFCIGAY